MPKMHRIYADVKKELLGDGALDWDETHFDLVSKCCGEKRLDIAKKWLQDWDLLSKIDEADEQIRNEKDRMKNQGIGFRGHNTVTDDLNNYIQAVKNNVKNLASALKVNE
jgi:hypothetical protein